MSLSFTRTSLLLAAPLVSCLLITGCSVDAHKNNGKDDVSITTPLGGMHVKTNGTTVLSSIGLPGYPGAVSVKDNEKDKGSADVDMNFGNFHLRIRAADFRSTDPPEKIRAFYRKSLAQYGDIIECKDKVAIGTPTHTGQGLTCNEDNKSVHGVHTSDDDTELKTGSKSHQRFVSFKPDGTGTRFALVLLDLPHDNDGDSN